MAPAPEDDLSSSSALVIDSNPTSRSTLLSQLREFGMGTVVQCARLSDARRQLEYRTFDLVVCEHHFPNEPLSGPDLLDDLRRNQLLPFSTVFIMVTGEATYAKVAEAAESALDGYLLKPHKASQLGERLRQARIRKISLAEIFAAIESEDFEHAAALCLHRFETRGLFWLYAMCSTRRWSPPKHFPGPNWVWPARCWTKANWCGPPARWKTSLAKTPTTPMPTM
jgi:CheY-like chemotaxis protein